MNRIAKAMLLVFLAAICGHAEYTFDNDKDIQEKENKRNMEREGARNLGRMRFGLKFGGGGGPAVIGDDCVVAGGGVGIMVNVPLHFLNVLNIPSIGEGDFWIASELNYGFRYDNAHNDYNEAFLHIPLLLQHANFFFPASDIKAHLFPSPKRHFLMHLKTIKEIGAFLDIPLDTDYDGRKDYKERNFFDFGGSQLVVQFKGYAGYLF
ncbi:MAG: hypothetical protein LBH25_04840 [Fibromonadaceae bacterium]|nr:hypothetical protein [Fibromonadaceae bacterium]